MKLPGAVFVAAGILLSRLAGLIRLRVFAHYFGLQSDAADAFNAAFRIPNFLQNLGEGFQRPSNQYTRFFGGVGRQRPIRLLGSLAPSWPWWLPFS